MIKIKFKEEVMTTLYAINSGEYSDYRVDALFTTRKLAEEFMAATSDADSCSEYNEIEEFELNPPAANLINRGYFVWLVLMMRNGNIESADTMKNTLYNVRDVPSHSLWAGRNAPGYRGAAGLPVVICSKVWAKTQKQAIKIVNEKRVQMIAMGEWV